MDPIVLVQPQIYWAVQLASETGFRLGASVAASLQARFGTPLYVLDEGEFRTRIHRYRNAMSATWPSTRLAYASKANSVLAANRIAYSEGCLIDAASEGEIEAALRAGVPPSDINLHGNNKSSAELERALDLGIRQVIVDCFEEIERLANLRFGPTQLLARLAPGVDPITHRRIATGQDDTKFGFNVADGSAERAVARMRELGLPLVGFHAHVGSQLLDPAAQTTGARVISEFAWSMRERHGVPVEELNLGGGLGVRYTKAQQEPVSIEEYVALVHRAVREAWPGEPGELTLVQEPGRALISDAGVTLYTVGSVKKVALPSERVRRYVAVDGGVADNPRPSLYDAVYTVEAVRPSGAPLEPATVSGRHCETDLLFEDVELPADLRAGDLLQVLSTGAYNNSMASNYNRYPRPAMVLLRLDGRADLVQRPDEWDEMFARESVPEDL